MVNRELDELRKSVTGPLPNAGIERKLVIAAFLILFVGVLASYFLSDWDHFARSGSVMVVLAVVIAWRDFSGRITSYKAAVQADYEQRLLQGINEQTESEEERKLGQDFFERKRKKMAADLDPIFNILTKRMRIIEVSLLVLGTLIWGFGDLLSHILPTYA